MNEYTGPDGNRYRYRQTDAGLVHESYDGIDQEGNETWVECPVVNGVMWQRPEQGSFDVRHVDEGPPCPVKTAIHAWQSLPWYARWWYWVVSAW